MREASKSNLGIVAVTILAALAAIGLIVNLSGAEKMVSRPLAHLYAIEDPQFQRTMGALLDAAFARKQEEIFESDLKGSKRMTLEEWRCRPFAEKVWEHAAALLGPQL